MTNVAPLDRTDRTAEEPAEVMLYLLAEQLHSVNELVRWFQERGPSPMTAHDRARLGRMSALLDEALAQFVELD